MVWRNSSKWTRREFLAASAAAGGGFLLLGFNPLGNGKTRNAMKSDTLEQFFPIAEEDARRTIAKLVSRGADLGELFLESTVRSSLVWEDGRVKNASWVEDGGVGLRAVRGDAQAYGYTQQFDAKELLRVAKNVCAVANFATPGTCSVFPQEALASQKLYSPSKDSVLRDNATKVDLLRRADAAARAYSPLITRVDISLVEELKVVALLNSEGGFTLDRQPMLSFRVYVIANKGKVKQQGLAAGGGRVGLSYFTKVSPEALAKRAAEIAVKMLDARPAPAGEQTVVLAPGDSGVFLHEAVGHGLEADFNRKGTSKYSGRIGQMVASPLCTVVDDAGIPQSRGSIHVDDEGHTSGRNILIEKGKLVGYMHDYLSAKHYKVPFTGNGRRESYKFPPIPRMTNTYMLPGEHDPNEIILGTRSGIYCKTFSGGQVNISNGDFVFQVVESYLIEKGKLTAPLKDVVIIGNGPDALSRVSMVGNDLVLSDGRWTCGKSGQLVPVGVGIPTVKIDGITVGGTA